MYFPFFAGVDTKAILLGPNRLKPPPTELSPELLLPPDLRASSLGPLPFRLLSEDARNAELATPRASGRNKRGPAMLRLLGVLFIGAASVVGAMANKRRQGA